MNEFAGLSYDELRECPIIAQIRAILNNHWADEKQDVCAEDYAYGLRSTGK